jgi:hypothetical protein
VAEVGDTGYQGTGLVTPIKKKPGLELTEEEKWFNASVASVRVGARARHRVRAKVEYDGYAGFSDDP